MRSSFVTETHRGTLPQDPWQHSRLAATAANADTLGGQRDQ